MQGLLNGDVKVVAAAGSTATLEFQFNGATVRMDIPTALFRQMIAPAPPPSRTTVTIDQSMRSSRIFQLVKDLQHSKKLGPEMLDAQELLDVITASESDTTGVLATTPPSDPQFAIRATIGLAMAGGVVNNTPTATVWPNLDATRLGEQIKAKRNSPSPLQTTPAHQTAPPTPPSQFPRTQALEDASTPAEFDKFLKAAVPIVCKPQFQAAAFNSPYIQKGALEAHLVKVGANAAPGEIKKHYSSLQPLSADALVLELMGHLAADGDTSSSAGNSQALAANPAPVQVLLSMPNSDLSTDNQDALNTLRGDASEVLQDKAVLQKIAQAHKLCDPEDATELYNLVKTLPENAKRLCTSSEDLNKALHGESRLHTHPKHRIKACTPQSMHPHSGKGPKPQNTSSRQKLKAE